MSKKPSPKPDADNVERDSLYKAFYDALYLPDESIELVEKQEEEVDWEYENERLSLENREEKRHVRQKWNLILTVLVVAGFVLSYAMITLIGLGIMKFESNAFAVPSVVAAGVIQTYGLAKLAIKYFFSEDGDKKDDSAGRGLDQNGK